MEEITHELTQEAKKHPNGWVYKIDTGYDINSDIIPPEAIVGAWKVDANGCLTGEFIQNKNYIPSNKNIF